MPGWNRFKAEKLEKNEKQLIQVSGAKLVPERVLIGNNQYLYCLGTNEPSKPLLILLHGYGGSGLCFYGLSKHLSEHYNLLMVDLLGMGRSSRPYFHPNGVEECEDFFVESIEALRLAKEFKDFVLLGHSFGGYIAGCYYMKYPQNVKGIIFLSPVGVNTKPPNYQAFRMQNASWRLKIIFKLVLYGWKHHFSPMSVIRKSGPFSKKLVRFYTRRKLNGIDPVELKPLEKYLEQICLLPGSGEYALTHILQPGAWAHKPLWERLRCLNIPSLFLYGDQDWMDPAGALLLKEEISTPIVIETVREAGHQVFWDNAPEVSRQILEFTYEHLSLT